MGSWAAVCVLFALCSAVQSTEFVPVYSWTTSSSAEKVPALQKISQDTFKDYVLEQLKADPFIVVFAEQTLSPEDFAQKDAEGRTAFEKLSHLQSTTYRPYVQNPVRAFKHVVKDFEEVSIESIKTKLVIPKTRLLIINLNDAKDDEERGDLLSRHDSNIDAIYKQIIKEYSNVVAYYTAYHTSWVPSETTESRQRRSLLADDDTTKPTIIKNCTYYVTGKAIYTNKNESSTTEFDVGFTSVLNSNTTLTVTSTYNNKQILNLVFVKTELDYIQLSEGKLAGDDIHHATDVYMANGFSYHCSNLTLQSSWGQIVIPGLQIQPFSENTTFADSYDCVGFTSAPIWSGLFVTFILLFIMSIGLTMMMDIRTMDRFDDAKGKTITINTSE